MIRQNVQRLLNELPQDVQLEAACKTRTPEEILEAIDGGIKIVGENYVQEAEHAFKIIGKKVKWHLIGHLQKNKVKKAVKIFDMIETVDSLELAGEINKVCLEENTFMPVLVEVNSGSEKQKFGIMPLDVEEFIKKLSDLSNIKVMGIMTMGPMAGKDEDARPYFSETKKIFRKIMAIAIPNIEMKYLSMGMSNSYKVAIEEGANIVRVGTGIFGERKE